VQGQRIACFGDGGVGIGEGGLRRLLPGGGFFECLLEMSLRAARGVARARSSVASCSLAAASSAHRLCPAMWSRSTGNCAAASARFRLLLL